jgi:hypothetical protein
LLRHWRSQRQFSAPLNEGKSSIFGKEAHYEQLKEMDKKMTKETITKETIEVEDVSAGCCGGSGDCGCGSN